MRNAHRKRTTTLMFASPTVMTGLLGPEAVSSPLGTRVLCVAEVGMTEALPVVFDGAMDEMDVTRAIVGLPIGLRDMMGDVR